MTHGCISIDFEQVNAGWVPLNSLLTGRRKVSSAEIRGELSDVFNPKPTIFIFRLHTWCKKYNEMSQLDGHATDHYCKLFTSRTLVTK